MNDPPPTPSGPWNVLAIGWVRSPYQRRFGTPRQATAGEPVEARLELDPARFDARSVRDLAGMDRIWVISWLDRGGNWSSLVRTPRDAERRSLFSTRSPDRPNPIGLSAVELVGIDGCNLLVRGIDLLDGTPILDLKPYVPYADAFPEAKAGWIDQPHPRAAKRSE